MRDTVLSESDDELALIEAVSWIPSYIDTGCAWLAERDQDWFTKVDIEILDMVCPICCIVGQVFGSYQDHFPMQKTDAAVRHGFCIDTKLDDSDQMWAYEDALTAAWRQRIDALRRGVVFA